MNERYSIVMQFEEFFTEKHKKDLFEILESYPKKRSIIINYDDLEMFDPDLADLLIEKPEEVIGHAKYAITEIDPLVKNADINPRFINIPKMELTEISAVNIGGFVSTEVHISKVSEIKPKIKTAVFECRGCMRLHEVEQTCGDANILEPSLCSECGGRSFRFLREDSAFVDSQQVDILKTEIPSRITYPTKLLLEDDGISGELYKTLQDDSILNNSFSDIEKQLNNNIISHKEYLNYIESITEEKEEETL